jgi:predicted AAA+ superfamily ATPase
LTDSDGRVEIKNNNLSLFNIDALFQKEFRLKTVASRHYYLDREIIKKPIKMVFVTGPYLSGKTTVCKLLANKLGYKIIDWKAFEDKVKKTKGTEEEPFEGEVNPNELVAAVQSYLQNLKPEELS